MKPILTLLLIFFFSSAYADDTAKICTSDYDRTKAISVSDFDSVDFPVSVEELVRVWGLGYRNDRISGTGIIYWRCADGRIATVGPVSSLKTILNDPDIDFGDAQVSFFASDVEWYPFPLQISITPEKDAGHNKSRHSSPDRAESK
ncbi:MAG: hypothetical protein P1U82_24315 [Verrucomicrobiales bacterium]|nr:hypothetical protein [Verrucomicrobiales bacterium]